MPDLLFVYGSLRSEFDNPHVRRLRQEAVSLGHATVRGSLFLIGEYSGYRAEPDGIVHGELWKLHTPDKTLAALDRYEGKEYPRVLIDVEEPRASAWIYHYTGPVDLNRRIESGDLLTP